MQRVLSSFIAALLTGLFSLYTPVLMAADAPCAACHAEAAESHGATPHGKAAVACSSCHGDGKAHLSAPNASTIRTFTNEPAAEQNSACAGCHQSAHGAKPNAHTAAGITCASCHSIHAQKKSLLNLAQRPAEFERLPEGSGLCFDCHQETFTQFAFNERHRLPGRWLCRLS